VVFWTCSVSSYLSVLKERLETFCEEIGEDVCSKPWDEIKGDIQATAFVSACTSKHRDPRASKQYVLLQCVSCFTPVPLLVTLLTQIYRRCWTSAGGSKSSSFWCTTALTITGRQCPPDTYMTTRKTPLFLVRCNEACNWSAFFASHAAVRLKLSSGRPVLPC